MAYSMRGPASGWFLWLLVGSVVMLSACSPARQSAKPVAPISLFGCGDIAVPPFAWLAPEDTVYLESEEEKGRDVPPHGAATAMELAKKMAASLKEKGASASAVSLNGGSLQEQVAELKALGYPCVVLGRVERYEERIGSDWSVNRPASVSFKLLLMETGTGRVVWKGAFDEAQQPLSENLLTIKRFVKRKARWVTAGDLAETGFRKLVASMAKTGARSLPAQEVPEEP